MNGAEPVAFTCDFELDCARLAHWLQLSRQLPDADFQRGLEIRVRKRFAVLHAGAVYDAATDVRRKRIGLTELVDFAAALVPGLVPTAAERMAEAARRLGEKSGREIETGILLWGVLRSPGHGGHLMDALSRPTSWASAELSSFQRTGYAEFGPVTVRRDAGAGHVTLNNTRYLNAEDEVVVAALEAAVDLVLLDDTTDVGVLRGAEMRHRKYAGQRVFGAGINLSHLRDGRISLLDFMLARELGYINKMSHGLSGEGGRAKPWVAAVDAFAIGGSAQVTLVCDHVIADRNAYFSLPALREGLIPGVANLRLPQLVGARLARRMIFLDHSVRATDPEIHLLCDEVVEPELMDAAIAAAVARLRNAAVPANRKMMNCLPGATDALRQYLAEYSLEQAIRLHSMDLVENLDTTWVARARPEDARSG